MNQQQQKARAKKSENILSEDVLRKNLRKNLLLADDDLMASKSGRPPPNQNARKNILTQEFMVSC